MRLLQTEHIKSGTHKKDGNVTLTNGTYVWAFVHKYLKESHNLRP